MIRCINALTPTESIRWAEVSSDPISHALRKRSGWSSAV